MKATRVIENRLITNPLYNCPKPTSPRKQETSHKPASQLKIVKRLCLRSTLLWRTIITWERQNTPLLMTATPWRGCSRPLIKISGNSSCPTCPPTPTGTPHENKKHYTPFHVLLHRATTTPVSPVPGPPTPMGHRNPPLQINTSNFFCPFMVMAFPLSLIHRRPLHLPLKD